MDEFSLIETYFKTIQQSREDVVLGIGDDAACLRMSPDCLLVVSSDTLVANVHFLASWDAYDIAYKAVMVNVSDMAAMGATPCWLTLALTLPDNNAAWLKRYSEGLRDALSHFNIALIGGDTTRGPLSMTLTIHGQVAEGRAIRRSGAAPGDTIYVSGELGAAALAVACAGTDAIPNADKMVLMHKLQRPMPRIDLGLCLQAYATAAIDISDGLAADLNHLCEASHCGACLHLEQIPVHPLVKIHQEKTALDFALHGGDDYELCFTMNPALETQFLECLKAMQVRCFPIGVMEAETGLRGRTADGEIIDLSTRGYRHF